MICPRCKIEMNEEEDTEQWEDGAKENVLVRITEWRCPQCDRYVELDEPFELIESEVELIVIEEGEEDA